MVDKTTQRHIRVAQDLREQHFINLPVTDLAKLVEGTPEFDQYIAEMR